MGGARGSWDLDVFVAQHLHVGLFDDVVELREVHVPVFLGGGSASVCVCVPVCVCVRA